MNRTSQSLQESVPSKQHALLLPTLRELMCALSLYYGRPSYIQATAGTGSASSACFWAPLQDSATHRERNKTPESKRRAGDHGYLPPTLPENHGYLLPTLRIIANGSVSLLNDRMIKPLHMGA